jgi:hypothetical protein
MRPIIAITAACTLASALLLSACGSPSVEAPPAASAEQTVVKKKGVPGGIILTTVTLTVRVKAKDDAARTLTVLTADMKEETVTVPKEAVNFDQVHVGDLVVVTTAEQIALAVFAKDAPVAEGEAILASLAEPGQKPAGTVITAVQVLGTVTALDLTARTATVTTEAGQVRVLPVRDDIDLTRQHVGDQVVMRVTSLIDLQVKPGDAKP